MNVGKAKVRISAEGCIDCGTLWSHAWEVARVLTIRIGKRTYQLDIHRCGDCMKKQQPKLF